VDPVPDPVLLRKSGTAWNRTRSSGSVARDSGLVVRVPGYRSRDYLFKFATLLKYEIRSPKLSLSP
jgi:hypothetical protein